MVHKHDKIIKAWLEGKSIQVQHDLGTWYNLPNCDAPGQAVPAFAPNLNYRIKPKDNYKKYLNVYHADKHDSLEDARKNIWSNSGFVCTIELEMSGETDELISIGDIHNVQVS